MPSFQALIPIAFIVGSFIAGFIFFYVMSPLTKEVKKQQAEAVLSLLINFVIYMWVGKIILNLSTFIEDPFAVLAYPSNSHAFYLAVLFSMLHIGYKVKRHRLDGQLLFQSFIYVFLPASFVYECMDIIWMGNRYTWGYLVLLFILLLILMLLQNVALPKRNGVMLFAWSIGQLLLALILPYAATFGYLMEPWFLVILLAGSIWLFFRST